MGWREVLECCFPHYYHDSVSDIPFEEFWRMGYRGVIFDVDDTLTRHHGKEIHQKAQQGLESAVETGFKMCALTNCTKEREEEVKSFLEMHVIVPEKPKPSEQGFEEAVTYFSLPKEEILMVGDHILTDIYGANKYGVTTVLVKPISKFSPKNLEIQIYKALHRVLATLTSCNQSS